MATPVYPSDVNEDEWALLAPSIPPAKPRGRPRSVESRRVVDGVSSLLRSGCAWLSLPREYCPWQTVYWYFRLWRLEGTRVRIQTELRELARLHAGRDPIPSTVLVDSQSVKTPMGGARGFDGGELLAGRQRPMPVDARRSLRAVVVHPANLPDRRGGRLVLEVARGAFPRLQRSWADQGGNDPFVPWTALEYGPEPEVISRRQLRRYAPDLAADPGYGPGFRVVPRRLVVEHTFSYGILDGTCRVAT